MTDYTKTQYTDLDYAQVIKHSFDEPKDSLRTLSSTMSVYPFKVAQVALAGSTTTLLLDVAHGAIPGDIIRFTAGANAGYETVVKAGLSFSADAIPVAELPFASVGDTFDILKPVHLTSDASGNLVITQGPVKFVLDTVDTEVEEDTATPANNKALPSKMFFQRNGVQVPVVEDTVTPANNLPLPVKITSVTGDINITAGDLNVQLSDQGLNPDVTRIGDGTSQMKLKANGAGLGLHEVYVTDTKLESVVVGAAGSEGVRLGDGTTNVGVTLSNELKTASKLVYTRDGSDQVVIEDTVTPANNRPLPVNNMTRLTASGATPDVVRLSDGTNTATINANGQVLGNLVHDGTTPSSIRLGDGTTQVGVKPVTNELKVVDATLALPIDVVTPGAEFIRTRRLINTGLAFDSVRVGNGTNDLGINANNQALANIVHNGTTPSSVQLGDGTTLVGVTTTNELKVSTDKPSTHSFASNNCATTNITTAAYVQLVASTAATTRRIQVMDTSGAYFIFAVGAALSEVDVFISNPGSDKEFYVNIPAGSRLSVKALDANATAGYLAINLIG